MAANISKQVKQYSIGYIIGKGSSSSVYQAYDTKKQQFFAAKFISREIFHGDGEYLRHVESELRILERLDHPYIAKFVETIFLENYIVIITELCVNGTLSQYNLSHEKLPDSKIYTIVQQTASALNYLHSRGIFHRDIKPDNIGFDENMNVKLIDFGFSTESQMMDQSLACGTPYFIAPEVIYSETYDGAKADMWSLGAMVYYLVNKQSIFGDLSPTQYMKKLGKVNTVEINGYGHMKKILESLIQMDPKQRLSASDLLKLPIFTGELNIRARSASLPIMSNSKSTTSTRRLIIRPTMKNTKSFIWL
ncbi:CAMK family protein kinase [Trichomonas vaginalis G3]|uniref:CAMK family protein kinase n=1 Tax=Trichomonas vaginalis (strain ATCC PRA-98 / G3) TaxID=412133 RepID=A2F7B1_TRIV3|nr:protein serine/threonine kinase protein [Trichomonas vaginalis G3]EAX99226.1 CAMK family protein kinase [Trichomonas vaginalis G3]KAI5538722.1 protein serine/threonine kinase protein [Trichomonas vaginalis G3]|eukprot:XP_001312156.1 CAMK family protein kinase [Trichomonas vaginalis G3]